MNISQLKSAHKAIGAKQTIKAIKRGQVALVFIGSDSDVWLAEELRDVCGEYHIPVNDEHTMEALGQAAQIKVKAAAVGVLR